MGTPRPFPAALNSGAIADYLAPVGADSPPETFLRPALAWAGLPEPLLNNPIYEAGAGLQHEPDMSYREYRIAIEYVGSGHNATAQVERDIDRVEHAVVAGGIEVRISKRPMRNDRAAAVSKIRSVLLRGRRPAELSRARAGLGQD